MKLNEREIATILAALRERQHGMIEATCKVMFDDIADNMGQIEPLTETEIDTLCEQLLNA